MNGYRQGDTIAAEATPHGRGGIAVIRVSGGSAREIVAKLFDAPLPEVGRHRFGRLILPEQDGRVVDEVVVALFAAPHSYSGEDVVEISTHGSPMVVSEALEALYAAGARPAEPGEFTLRAFLNGRLDLTQAEAVGDLIAASSRQAARQAVRQLEGGIGAAAREVSDLVERLLIGTELELDFVEEDVELMVVGEKIRIADEAVAAVKRMLLGYQASRRMREGVRVVISGAPNVGKSSLFNALLGESRAIVSRQAGTTRDVVSARTVIGGIEFELFDTAGIRKGEGEIEDEGIRRAVEASRRADLIVGVDSPETPGDAGEQVVGDIAIRVRNKADLGGEAVSDRLMVSSLTGEGVEELRSVLLQVVTGGEAAGAGTISRERHYVAVTRALEALRRGRAGLAVVAMSEMIAEEWREALAALDELTGRRRLEGLLDAIFAEFCIGK